VLRVLLIGGKGFIGSYLDSYLKEKKYLVDIVSIDKHGKSVTHNSHDESIELCKTQLEKYDAFIYLAWASNPSTAEKSPLCDIENSVITGLHWIERIGVLKTNPLVVFFSSGGAVYGDLSKGFASEDLCLNPSSSYGISKAYFEKYLEIYSKKYNFPCVIIRPSNIYGPYDIDQSQGALFNFTKNIILEKSLKIWGGMDAVRDYLYISDLTVLVERIIKCKTGVYSSGVEIVNAGSGVGISLEGLIGEIELAVQKESVVEILEEAYNGISRNVLNISHAKRKYEWSPQVSLKEGILNVANYITHNKK
jgi:UDP-glucose 4-epimerase